jgi:hypothetical protein
MPLWFVLTFSCTFFVFIFIYILYLLFKKNFIRCHLISFLFYQSFIYCMIKSIIMIIFFQSLNFRGTPLHQIQGVSHLIFNPTTYKFNFNI